jgi:hypothetical protein
VRITRDGVSINVILLNPEFPRDHSAVAQAVHLFHELGHLLVRGACDKDLPKLLRECRADAFMALRCIARFGQEGLNFIQKMAGYRALETISARNTDHLTTGVLDGILQESPPAPPPEEMREKALHYAKKYAPTQEDVLAFYNDHLFWNSAKNAWAAPESELRRIRTSCLETRNAFSFVAGAYIVLPALSGHLEVNGLQLTPADITADCEEFARRAREMGLSRLGKAFLAASDAISAAAPEPHTDSARAAPASRRAPR